ncbi:MAG: glycosyltransferase [bacterium]
MQNNDLLDISVVIPCLNEARTVGRCVEAAIEGIGAAGLSGEVIVADNGSSDRSRERAVAAGARIVSAERRGYGAAVQAGFLAARGKLLVMGDADLSYDFREIQALTTEQSRTGAGLVIGDRLNGRIERGAMPWAHRVIGNPAISRTIRLIFGTPVNDCYCGLRLITRDAHRRLRLTSTGMEYALEMIVLAKLAGITFANVPVTLRMDDRDRPPHLRTIRDGYRSFRFLFQHAPITVYLAPGLCLIAGALVQLASTAWREIAAGAPAPLNALTLAAGGVLLLGWVMILLGVIARMFAAGFLHGSVDPLLPRFFQLVQLEHGVSICLVAVAAGFGLLACDSWSHALFYLGVLGLVMGAGTLFGAFVVSLIGRAVPDNRFYPSEERGERAGSSRRNALGADEQNVPHSLATQAVLARAPRYNEWLFDSVAEALHDARRILDAGCSIGNMTNIAAFRATCKAGAGSGIMVVGLEVIPAAVAEFRRRYAGRADMMVVEGDIMRPPDDIKRRAPFDCALCFNVLEHLEDDTGALRIIGSLLKPGGMLGLVIPGGGNALYGTLDALDLHCRRYTKARLRARLEASGYKIVSIRHVNAAGYFLWFLKGRILHSKKFRDGETAAFDKLVPFLRKLDSLVGPPFGQSIAVVARRGEQPQNSSQPPTTAPPSG